MSFKKASTYNEERFGNLFLLRNDGDEAKVIFLYRNFDDVLIGYTHYVKSNDYNGYVHCLGRGCPACSKGLRVQTKLFIPLYNCDTGEIQFWDRSSRFENQLETDVFKNYPDPSQFVFTIQRKGAAGSMDTTYSIVATDRNTYKTYDQILAENNIESMEKYYNNVCKEVTASELSAMLSNGGSSNSSSNLPDYTPTPRGVAPAAMPDVPAPVVEVPEFSDEELNSLDVPPELEPIDIDSRVDF